MSDPTARRRLALPAEPSPVVMAGDHARAGRYIARLLWITARRRWRELRALVPIDETAGVTT